MPSAAPDPEPAPKETPARAPRRRGRFVAGGNPHFDERFPRGRPDTPHAGGNPHFDERYPGGHKPKSS